MAGSFAQAAGAPSRIVGQLSDSTFWPEGVDVDPTTGTFYIASVKHGTIAVLARNGAVRELLPRGLRANGSILGVRYDATRRVVWATTSGIRAAGTLGSPASLIEVRPSDGVVLRRWTLGAAPQGRVIGDLAIGTHGEIYFTDSVQPELYLLRSESDSLDAIHSPLFESLQGMAPTSDGRFVYVADYSSGLLKLDVRTRQVTRVAAAPQLSTRGCDGIVLNHNAIIAVQNGVSPPRIVRFTLAASGDSIAAEDVVDRNPALADEPTIGTMLGDDFVYVANSQWEKYDDRGARVSSRPLTAPVLLGVPVP